MIFFFFFFFGGAIVLKSGFVVICIVRTKNHPSWGIIYGSSGSSLIDRQFTYKKEKKGINTLQWETQAIDFMNYRLYKIGLLNYKRKVQLPMVLYGSSILMFSSYSYYFFLYLFLLFFLLLSFFYPHPPPRYIGVFLFLSLQLSCC